MTTNLLRYCDPCGSPPLGPCILLFHRTSMSSSPQISTLCLNQSLSVWCGLHDPAGCYKKTICQSVTSNRDQDTNKGPMCLWGTVLNYIPVFHSLSQQCYDGNEHWNVWKQIFSNIHVVVIEKFVINTMILYKKYRLKRESMCTTQISW